jgi:hypothetical protein
MVGEAILTVSVALGCALLGCGAVYLAAKIPMQRPILIEPLSGEAKIDPITLKNTAVGLAQAWAIRCCHEIS